MRESFSSERARAALHFNKSSNTRGHTRPHLHRFYASMSWNVSGHGGDAAAPCPYIKYPIIRRGSRVRLSLRGSYCPRTSPSVLLDDHFAYRTSLLRQNPGYHSLKPLLSTLQILEPYVMNTTEVKFGFDLSFEPSVLPPGIPSLNRKFRNPPYLHWMERLAIVILALDVRDMFGRLQVTLSICWMYSII